MKTFLLGAAAGYVAYLICPHYKITKSGGSWGGGNLRGNAGGFAGGNPGMPQGPGFFR